uniref:Uncharacterized protein n=1 Tax=Micrurus spixii TaxID=129469 RepID=A0A2D4N0E0_9SAUR
MKRETKLNVQDLECILTILTAPAHDLSKSLELYGGNSSNTIFYSPKHSVGLSFTRCQSPDYFFILYTGKKEIKDRYKLLLHSLTSSKILKCGTLLEDASGKPTYYLPNNVIQQIVRRGILSGTLCC